ncbi:MAG TPA: hypothetical protein ENG48_13325, partial [Candidatus Atribacteria bacterium]|nr:hypothetical protein [Candidatus Atribacteria bacterium]
MKKIILLLLIVMGITILIPLPPAFTQSSEINILLNQKPLATTVSSIIENDRIFVPARNIVEALGGRITWFPALKLLNIYIDNHTVSLVIDDP